MWSFPAGFLAEFFENHRVLQLRGRPAWRSIAGGSRRYVEALIAPFRERVHLRAPVRSLARGPDGVTVELDGASERFDEVVLAVHSDVALALLADPSPAEAQVLGAIPYQRNEAVLHTDTRLMPRRRAAWASWNYHLTDEAPGRTTVTYHMNRLQSLEADREFLVTLNRTEAIDPDKVIREIDYAHPVFTPEGVEAQARWAEISGVRRTHYCGAYWRWGFHEDGVWSALRVSEALGGRGPLAQPGEAGAVVALPEPSSRRARGGGMSASAIYEGWVAHRRRGPVPHSFRYRIFLPLFDLDELPELLDSDPPLVGPPAGARAVAPRRLSRRWPPPPRRGRPRPLPRPHRAPAGGPREAARQPALPRRRLQPGLLLLPLRRVAASSVEAVIAEVTNTPWGERTSYVLDGRSRTPPGTIHGGFDKAMHVSPFMPMEQSYEISVGEPGDELRVAISNLEAGSEVFTATLALRRRELTRARMVGPAAPLPADDDRDAGADLLKRGRGSSSRARPSTRIRRSAAR